MPCKDQWITRDGKVMDMHDMTDDHILNAYALLDEAQQEAEYDGQTKLAYELSDSKEQLEGEAERRWGREPMIDGESLLRDRLQKRAGRCGPPEPPIVGKR